MDKELKTKIIKYTITILIVSLILLLPLKGVVSLWNDDSKDFWLTIGLSSILVMLLSNGKGVTVFFAVLLIGTLVAREEFILEIAALSKGETLSDVRDSRAFNSEDVIDYNYIPQDDIEQLAKIIDKLIDEKKTSKEIAESIIEEQEQIQINAAAITMNTTEKEIIKYLTLVGGSTEDELIAHMKSKNINNYNKEIMYLKNTAYINIHYDSSIAYLTGKGVGLSKKLGFR